MIGGRVSLSLIVAGALGWAAASQDRLHRAAPARSRPIEAKLDLTPVSRIGGEPEPILGADIAPKSPEAPVARGADLSPMLAAAALYQKGDLAGGDAAAKVLDDPLQRVALEWIALKSSPHADYARLAAFGAAHPEWPAGAWIRYQQEAALYNDRAHPQIAAALFAASPPRTPAGKLTMARIARTDGHLDQAVALVRSVCGMTISTAGPKAFC